MSAFSPRSGDVMDANGEEGITFDLTVTQPAAALARAKPAEGGGGGGAAPIVGAPRQNGGGSGNHSEKSAGGSDGGGGSGREEGGDGAFLEDLLWGAGGLPNNGRVGPPTAVASGAARSSTHHRGGGVPPTNNNGALNSSGTFRHSREEGHNPPPPPSSSGGDEGGMNGIRKRSVAPSSVQQHHRANSLSRAGSMAASVNYGGALAFNQSANRRATNMHNMPGGHLFRRNSMASKSVVSSNNGAKRVQVKRGVGNAVSNSSSDSSDSDDDGLAARRRKLAAMKERARQQARRRAAAQGSTSSGGRGPAGGSDRHSMMTGSMLMVPSGSEFRASSDDDRASQIQSVLGATSRHSQGTGGGGGNYSDHEGMLTRQELEAISEYERDLVAEASYAEQRDRLSCISRWTVPTKKLKYSSLFIFSPTNRLRALIYNLSNHKVFEGFIILNILANTIVMAFTDPKAESQPYEDALDIYFTVIFTLEMVAKIISLGFVLHKGAYLRSSWNVLDFCIVVLAYVNYLPGMANLTALRAIRVLRPLRSMNAIGGIRFIVMGLLKSVAGLVHVMTLLGIVFLIFGIGGVQLWMGTFRYRCVPTVELEAARNATAANNFTIHYVNGNNVTMDHLTDWGAGSYCKPGNDPGVGAFGYGCPLEETCTNVGDNGDGNILNFDSFPQACMMLFVVMTFEGWPGYLTQVYDVWGQLSFIYFFVFLIFASYFVPNLALAVINEKFVEVHNKQLQEEELELMEAEQKAVDDALAKAREAQLLQQPKSDASHSNANDPPVGVGGGPPPPPCSAAGGGMGSSGDVMAPIVAAPPRKSIAMMDDVEMVEKQAPTSNSASAAVLGVAVSTNHFGVDAAPAAASSSSSPPLPFVSVSGVGGEGGGAAPLSPPPVSDVAAELLQLEQADNSSATALLLRGENTFVFGTQAELADLATTANSVLLGSDADAFSSPPHDATEEGDAPPRTCLACLVDSITALRRWMFLHIEGYEKPIPTANGATTEADAAAADEASFSLTVYTVLLMVCIVLNSVLLASQHYGQPGWLTDLQNVGNRVFTGIFAADCVIRLFAFGFRLYFSEAMNWLDVGTSIASIVELFVGGSSIAVVFRCFRLFRLFKLFRNFKSFHKIIRILITSMRDTGFLSVFVLLYIYMAALVGMQLFGLDWDNLSEDDGGTRAGFTTFFRSVVTVFQMMTFDGWNDIIVHAVRVTNPAAVIYFVVCILIGNYLIIQLFLAILIGAFEEDDITELIDKEEAKRMHQLAQLQEEDAAAQRQYFRTRSFKALHMKTMPSRRGGASVGGEGEGPSPVVVGTVAFPSAGEGIEAVGVAPTAANDAGSLPFGAPLQGLGDQHDVIRRMGGGGGTMSRVGAHHRMRELVLARDRDEAEARKQMLLYLTAPMAHNLYRGKVLQQRRQLLEQFVSHSRAETPQVMAETMASLAAHHNAATPNGPRHHRPTSASAALHQRLVTPSAGAGGGGVGGAAQHLAAAQSHAAFLIPQLQINDGSRPASRANSYSRASSAAHHHPNPNSLYNSNINQTGGYTDGAVDGIPIVTDGRDADDDALLGVTTTTIAIPPLAFTADDDASAMGLGASGTLSARPNSKHSSAGGSAVDAAMLSGSGSNNNTNNGPPAAFGNTKAPLNSSTNSNHNTNVNNTITRVRGSFDHGSHGGGGSGVGVALGGTPFLGAADVKSLHAGSETITHGGGGGGGLTMGEGYDDEGEEDEPDVVCKVCGQIMHKSLPSAPLVPRRTTRELHQRMCQAMARRAANLQFLDTLVEFIDTQIVAGIPPQLSSLEYLLGQAWSWGLLVETSPEDLLGASVDGFDANATVNSYGWDACKERLEEERQAINLCAGEERVGRAFFSFVVGAIHTVTLETNGGHSLFVFGPENRLRLLVTEVLSHAVFDGFILFCILVSSLLLAFDTPRDKNQTLQDVLYYTDIVFTSIFCFEMVLKIVALGLVLHKGAYLRDPWNLLDCFIVIISLISLSVTSVNVGFLKVLRVFRALRPLRLVTKNRGIQEVVLTLFKSVKGILNVVIVAMLNYSIFAILGIQLFGGAFYRCTDAEITSAKACVGSFIDYDGNIEERRWYTSPRNYDNFGNALLTLFEVSTMEWWTDVLWDSVDSVGKDSAMKRDNNIAYALYYIAFIVVASFVLLNMFVGVMISSFNTVKAQLEGISMLTDDQRMWGEAQRILLNFKPSPYVHAGRLRISKWLFRIVTDRRFEFFIFGCVAVNILVLACDHYDPPAAMADALSIINDVFSVIFIIEVVAKIIAMELRFFLDPFSRMDFVLILISIVNFSIRGQSDVNINVLQVLRVFRILRIFRIVKKAKKIRILMEALWYSLPSMANVGGLMLLLLFLYSVMGVQLFYNIDQGSLVDDKYSNFFNFWNAFQLLVRFITMTDWNECMHDCMQQPPLCDDAEGECGTLAAPLYFISFIIFGSFILINLMVAIILDNFNTTTHIEKSQVRMQDIQKFIDVWSELDVNATMMIPIDKLPYLLNRLRPPLGISHAKSRYEMLLLCRKYEIPIHEGQLHFYETLIPLARVTLAVQMSRRALREQERAWREGMPDILKLPVHRVVNGSVATVDMHFAAVLIQSAHRRRMGRREADKRRTARKAAAAEAMERAAALESKAVLSSTAKPAMPMAGGLGVAVLQYDDSPLLPRTPTSRRASQHAAEANATSAFELQLKGALSNLSPRRPSGGVGGGGAYATASSEAPTSPHSPHANFASPLVSSEANRNNTTTNNRTVSAYNTLLSFPNTTSSNAACASIGHVGALSFAHSLPPAADVGLPGIVGSSAGTINTHASLPLSDGVAAASAAKSSGRSHQQHDHPMTHLFGAGGEAQGAAIFAPQAAPHGATNGDALLSVAAPISHHHSISNSSNASSNPLLAPSSAGGGVVISPLVPPPQRQQQEGGHSAFSAASMNGSLGVPPPAAAAAASADRPITNANRSPLARPAVTSPTAQQQ